MFADVAELCKTIKRIQDPTNDLSKVISSFGTVGLAASNVNAARLSKYPIGNRNCRSPLYITHEYRWAVSI
jgi:hypothetical protein